MSKHNSDYIPTYADIEIEKLKRQERADKSIRPVHTYNVTYKINSQEISETVKGSNATEVEDVIRHNCTMIGWIPAGLTVKLIEE